MDILEILYTREFKKVTLNVRKLSFNTKKILLLGPKGAGKSSMIYDYLSLRKRGSFLYIDFDDFRLKGVDISEELPQFLQKYQINLLVLENFNFNFEIPFCQEVIITTNRKTTLENFTILTLYPLDFEEFISFESRYENMEATFSNFAVIGTFPALKRVSREDFVNVYQIFLQKFAKNDLQMHMLQLLSSKQGRTVSMHELFLKIKLKHKISKDTFYAYCKKLQDEYVLFLVEKFEKKTAVKKLYLIDFALRSVLSFEKDFIKRFENIVFLELLKRDKVFYYTDAIDFYLPSEKKAILTIPFLPLNMIEKKLERISSHLISFGVLNVLVVTMEVEASYELQSINYELIPFWNFATL